MPALENALLDFLSNITARPDKKVNKSLMTTVEKELEQAKLTISNLRDTQMRQEIILRQYAEEVSPADARDSVVTCSLARLLLMQPARSIVQTHVIQTPDEVQQGCTRTARRRPRNPTITLPHGNPQAERG
jgi:hypothetical protein